VSSIWASAPVALLGRFGLAGIGVVALATLIDDVAGIL